MSIWSQTSGAATVPVRGDGSVTLDLTVGGTLNHPLPTGTLAVQSPSLEYGTFAPATGIALDAVIDPAVISFRTLTANWQGASLAAQGTLPWRVVLASVPATSKTGTRPPSRLDASGSKRCRRNPRVRRGRFAPDNATEAVLKDLVPQARLQEIHGSLSATMAGEAERLSVDRIHATAVSIRPR